MSDDVPLTRRRVLGGLAGAAALGSGAGAFTAATLGDRELLPIGTTAGAAGISIDCDARDCTIEDGVLQFAIDVVPDDETRSRTFTLAVDDNPVRVWARTDCPPESEDHHGHDGPPDGPPWHERNGEGSENRGPPDSRPPDRRPEDPPGRPRNGSSEHPSSRSGGENATTLRPPEAPRPTFGGDFTGLQLADALELRLSIADPCGSDGRRLYPEDGEGSWGTLRGFQTAFANGRRLDGSDPCFESGDGACLEFEYRLPWWYTFVGPDDEADLELELYAEQCRHVDESSVGNPFQPADCGSGPDPEPDPDPGQCPDCSRLGKLEVEDDRLGTGTYGFDELYGRFANDGHGYEIDVLDVENKDDGAETVCAEFALLRDGAESLQMCEVKLKGATERWVEELDPPSTRTPGLLCTGDANTSAGETAGRSGGSAHQPAISHLTVYVCDDEADDGNADHDEEDRGADEQGGEDTDEPDRDDADQDGPDRDEDGDTGDEAEDNPEHAGRGDDQDQADGDDDQSSPDSGGDDE